MYPSRRAGIESRIPLIDTEAKSGLKRSASTIQIGCEHHHVQSLEGDVVHQRICQHRVDRFDEFARKRSVLHFVREDVNDDVACELVADEQDHVIGDEVVGGESR